MRATVTHYRSATQASLRHLRYLLLHIRESRGTPKREEPVRMLSEESENEDIHQLTINEHFAKAYEYRKEREELAKRTCTCFYLSSFY